jgi:hypothetical protein
VLGHTRGAFCLCKSRRRALTLRRVLGCCHARHAVASKVGQGAHAVGGRNTGCPSKNASYVTATPRLSIRRVRTQMKLLGNGRARVIEQRHTFGAERGYGYVVLTEGLEGCRQCE